MASTNPTASTEKLVSPKHSGWSRKRKLIVGAVTAFVIVIALAVGLGVGLSRRHNSDDDSDSNTPITNTTDPDTNATMWKPAVGLTWQYVLKWPLNSTLPNNTQVWDIDLFDNSRATITGLQQNGAKVICYFSAGSYENWRSDKAKFHPDDLGAELNGWADERWLNVSSPNVRTVMLSRLDMAKQKGCNGVDPDNVDGYDNDNGLDLTKPQAVDYMKFLANAAHTRGLSIGLKNAGAIIPQVLPYMEWSVNEQCVQYNECDTYAAFIKAGKPVFHVEYPKGDKTNNNINVESSVQSRICGNAAAKNFSTIIKNMLLDTWKQSC